MWKQIVADRLFARVSREMDEILPGAEISGLFLALAAPSPDHGVSAGCFELPGQAQTPSRLSDLRMRIGHPAVSTTPFSSPNAASRHSA